MKAERNQTAERDTNLIGSIQLSAQSQTWRSAEAAGAGEDHQAPHKNLRRWRERQHYIKVGS